MTDSIDEITSLVSVPITICNVPDPKSIAGEFVYNFYVENEDKSYSPQPTSPIDYTAGLIDQDTAERIEERERGALRLRIPRFVRLKIGVNTEGIPTADPNEIDTETRLALTQYYSNPPYNIEGNVENKYNARVSISDSNMKARLQSEIYRVAAAVFEQGGAESEMSDEMIANSLNEMMSDDIDAASIMDALSDNRTKGINFVNQISGKVFNRIDNKSAIQYSAKINADAYRNITTKLVTSNPFSQYFESDILGSAASTISRNPLLNSTLFPTFGSVRTEDIQSLQPTLKTLSSVAESDAITVFGRSSLPALGYPTIKHIGYVVEKVGLSSSGEYETFRDFISLNPNISEFIDPNIKYGFTYFYKARQLFLVEFIEIIEIIDDSPAERVVYKIEKAIIASSSPKTATVQAKEVTPPPAPSTLICSFIYKEGNGIRLDWTRPNNPTRDIKKYQVFRRKSIREPFEIIAEYDFTDEGYTQFDQKEQIDSLLVKRVSIPQYSHTDFDFNRESTFIYAVASVDAHGLVSNYGTQIQASFDRLENTLRTKVLSKSGAPRAYPNFYIDPTELEEFGSDRLVEDVIKDGGHSRMRIYFSPDAYRVSSDADGTESQSIVLNSSRGSYKFQLVNLDRQISKNLTIQISVTPEMNRLL